MRYDNINSILFSNNRTPSHPFYVPEKGWTEAIDLRAGDILQTVNGEYVTVEAVQHEILETPVTVYNFEVKDFHTYFVGECGVLVHNTCSTNKLETTEDFVSEIENRDGKYYTNKATIDKIGQSEAAGEDFSLLNRKIMSSRPYTEGGSSIVYKYSDESGTKFIIHEVTDADGFIIHRDFDAVRIESGQLINKSH